MVQKGVCSPQILRGLGIQKKIYQQTTSKKEEALLVWLFLDSRLGIPWVQKEMTSNKEEAALSKEDDEADREDSKSTS